MEKYLENIQKELFAFLPEQTAKEDFDDFWKETIDNTRQVPLNEEAVHYDYPCEDVEVYKISYNGFDETRINGWYMTPRQRQGKIPCLINFHGYNGNCGYPAEFLQWTSMGIAVISIDCRGQLGTTGNSASYSFGMTQNVACFGILDKKEYYFRQVYMDCIKALDFAQTRPEVDETRLIINGGSQGVPLE